MRRLTIGLFLLMLIACGKSSDKSVPSGKSDFETPLGNSQYGPPMRGDVAMAEAADDSANKSASEQRLIEESDIYKIEGQYLFILNRYRGLQIIDIGNLDAPKLVGRVPIYGYPKDMYLRENRAYIIVSDYWSYWRDEAISSDAQGFYGSQLRIVDVSNVEKPTIVGAINLEGDCSDSRIVGDVMYLVSHRYPRYMYPASSDFEDMTSVLSVSIKDPTNIQVVDNKDFPRKGWEHHIYVNTQAIYLAASGYTNEYLTNIQYIDISDPHGAIKIRGKTQLKGQVRDRWAMDVKDQVLRVASGENWGNGDVSITTFSVENPDKIEQLGQYTLRVNEQLKSAIFDGDRGYLVTFKQTDPLFSFDLSDPANPKLLGELKMSGWLDYMVPMGDHVLALGHDEAESGGFSLAVSLVDVKSSEPKLLQRVPLPGNWGWVPGQRDDYAKVFRVIPEANLILVPFSAWDKNYQRSIGGVQLIDFNLSQETLAARGLIENAGWVERGVLHDSNTVLTISSEIFQIVDIANRDQPQLRAKLELARNVIDFALIDDYTVQLCQDRNGNNMTLTVTPKTNPDTAVPLASISIAASHGRLFQNDKFFYVTSAIQSNTEPYNVTRVQVFDLTNPTSPTLRGSVDLPTAVNTGYGYWNWGYGNEIVQVGRNALAFHRWTYRSYYLAEDPKPAIDDSTSQDAVAKASSQVAPSQDKHLIYLVDLANPDQPRLASTVELDSPWAWGLKAKNNHTLYFSDYTSFRKGESYFARYNLREIDISDRNNPVVGSPINIPGWLVGFDEQEPFIYTLESWWDPSANVNRTYLHALEIYQGSAYLQSSVEIKGSIGNLEFKGKSAFAIMRPENYSSVAVSVDSKPMDAVSRAYYIPQNQQSLVSFDLSDMKNIYIAGRVNVPDWGWLQKVAAGRAFIAANSGFFIYKIEEISKLQFDKFFRVNGWVENVVVEDNRAYLPSGYYGVQVTNL